MKTITLRIYVTDITKIKFIEKIEMWHGRIIELYLNVAVYMYIFQDAVDEDMERSASGLGQGAFMS